MLWLPRALKVLSDQVESEETQLRVTAQASTSWGLIGFGVAGVAIDKPSYCVYEVKKEVINGRTYD